MISVKEFVQLNEYETITYFLQVNQNYFSAWSQRESVEKVADLCYLAMGLEKTTI